MEFSTAMYWIIFVLLITLFIKRIVRLRKYRLPPGPFPWPLIGNILQLDQTGIHKSFIEWGKTYGGIFKIKFFTDDIIIVNDKELIYEVLIGKSSEFAGRQQMERVKILLGYHPDIIQSNISPEWSLKKKLGMKYLNKFGDVTGGKLEEITHCAINKMSRKIDKLSSQGDAGFDMKPVLHGCTSEVICSVFFHNKFSEEDLDKLLKIEKPILETTNMKSPNAYLDAFPFASYLPTKHVKEIFGLGQQIQDFFDEKTIEFKKNRDTKEPSCIMDAFVQYQKDNLDFDDKDIRNLAIDMVLAGFATTSTTSYALLAVVLNYPEIQEKIHEEISEVLRYQRPSLSDRPNMPYTEACILEVLRYSSILPTVVPHATMNDTKLGKYDIPAGTTVLPNVWYLHHNENLWEEPFAFKPERFLNEHGKIVEVDHPNRKNLLAFGAGRRICPGERLARNRLFLLITSLFQKYRFIKYKSNLPEYDPRSYDIGIVMMPKAYKVKVEKRK